MHLIERVLGIISDVHAPLSEPASHGTVESACTTRVARPHRGCACSQGAGVEAGAVRLWNGGGELVQIDAAIIARVNACKNLKELEVSERG